MKELYFKSFGYSDETGHRLHACFGIAIQFDDDLNVIKHIKSVNVYKNLKNSEEANIAAGLDILFYIKDQSFVEHGETLSFCITSNALLAFFDQEDSGNKKSFLASDFLYNKCYLFNTTLKQIRDEMNLTLNLESGISNFRNYKGIVCLSEMEEAFIKGVAEKIDLVRRIEDSKNNVIDAKINKLSVEELKNKEEVRLMKEKNEYFTEVNSFNTEINEKTLELLNRENVLSKLQESLEIIEFYKDIKPVSCNYF